MGDPFLVALVTLGEPGQLTSGYLYHRRLADGAPAQGARVEFVSVPDRPFPLAALDGGAVLARACGTGADVVVVDSIAAAFLAPWLVTHALDRPLAAVLHQPPGGIDHGPVRRRVQAVLDAAVYRRAARLLVASADLADTVVAAGLPADRVRVVPPGRDAPAADGAGGPPLDLREGRDAAVLCVGNWVARKGILDLLEAAARLPAAAVTVHLVGATDREPGYAARVRERLARPDLAGRVVVHGPVDRRRVDDLYRAADVFALPSRAEPYGTVYGEAMAAGLPVVGWRAGNLPHLAHDGREGVLLTPGDVAALAAALERLAADEEGRRRLARAAAARAATFPTWAETTERFVTCVRELKAAGAAGGGTG